MLIDLDLDYYLSGNYIRSVISKLKINVNVA